MFNRSRFRDRLR